MNEYEFRLVVQHPEPFALQYFCDRGKVETHTLLYADPHMRYRRRRLETKITLSTRIVYYKTLWFKWVHSLETPFSKWSPAQYTKYLEGLQTKSHFFEKQTRQQIDLDKRARLYTFKHKDGFYRLVFEWEYGSWSKPLKYVPLNDLLVHQVSRYWNIIKKFKLFRVPPYTIRECVIRKPVTYRAASRHCLVAHKWDGIFGIVYSYADYIKEKWEDGIQKRTDNVTLGDGLVFAAEKTSQGVILLDVYEAYGIPTASECRQSILTEFLPQLQLPDGFHIQHYKTNTDDLPVTTSLHTDGLIRHDLCSDTISKVKNKYSLDVVYRDGYFWLPSAGTTGEKRRFRPDDVTASLENGHVYEVDIDTGRVIRERPDRLTGNTWQQIDAILDDNRKWGGPTLETIRNATTQKKKEKKMQPKTKDEP